jgi:ElaB/YqjD/DUF883 family membrane-anchored ribosome-binding protein
MKRTRKAARRASPSIEDELANIGHDLASLGAVLGETASSEVSATLKSLRDRIDKLTDKASTVTDASVEEIRGAITENPFLSVAAAFGLGVFLASILRR